MNKKFRVWDKQQKEFHTDRDWGLSLDGTHIIGFSSHDSWNDDRGYKIKITKNLVVQQYIGVDDKNKNPIYEGDIVNFQYRDEGLYHGVVDFDDMYAGYSVQKSLAFFGNMQITFHNSAELTVVGNIFENPELLK